MSVIGVSLNLNPVCSMLVASTCLDDFSLLLPYAGSWCTAQLRNSATLIRRQFAHSRSEMAVLSYQAFQSGNEVILPECVDLRAS